MPVSATELLPDDEAAKVSGETGRIPDFLQDAMNEAGTYKKESAGGVSEAAVKKNASAEKKTTEELVIPASDAQVKKKEYKFPPLSL